MHLHWSVVSSGLLGMVMLALSVRGYLRNWNIHSKRRFNQRYSTSSKRFLNRILFESTEVTKDTTDGRSRVFLSAPDFRFQHIKEILKLSSGDSLRCGVVNEGLCDDCTVQIPNGDEISSSNNLWIDLGNREKWSTVERCRVDLLLAIPRPSRLTQLLPVISALGVDRLILLGAERVERAYFGSRLVCEDKDRRTLLTNGLMQCCVDYHLPELLVEKSLSRFLQYSKILAAYDTNDHEETIRIIAHPPYSDVGIEAQSSRTSFRSLMKEVTASPTKAPRRVVVAIGPEGGWLPSEVDAFVARGFRTYDIGNRVLRTDTAVPVLLGQAHELIRLKL